MKEYFDKSKFQDELDVLRLNQKDLDNLKLKGEHLAERTANTMNELKSFNELRSLKWETLSQVEPLDLQLEGGATWDALVNQARSSQARQACYSDFLTDKEIMECISAISLLRTQLSENYSTRMMEELRDNFLQSLIGPFGLSLDMLRAFDGGAIPTVHNANREEPIIPNDNSGEKQRDYQRAYEREHYAPKADMQSARKERLKDDAPIIDGYTNQSLERNGRSQIEHVISAKELHDDDWLRLYLELEERKGLANSDNNTTWTNASLNQSKQDRDLLKWMESPSTKDKTKTNAEYYNVDKEQAKELYSQAHQERNKHLYSKVGKDVMVQCGKTSVKMGLRKALGYILYELARGLFDEMKDMLSKKKEQSIKLKDELPGRLKTIAFRITDKWKEVIKQFLDGAIAGFVSELIIFLINNFITTMKRMVRIIKEGSMSLISMIRFLLNPPEDMLPEEVHHQCMKLGMSILVTSGGILLEEAIEKFLMAQVWLAPIAGFLAPVIAGLLTGLILSLLTYGIDKLDLFGARERKIDRQISQSIMDQLWEVEVEFDAVAAL